jgi:hypothetical protein
MRKKGALSIGGFFSEAQVFDVAGTHQSFCPRAGR